MIPLAVFLLILVRGSCSFTITHSQRWGNRHSQRATVALMASRTGRHFSVSSRLQSQNSEQEHLQPRSSDWMKQSLDYVSTLRPFTVLQAVGALIIGRLVTVSGQRISAQPARLFAAATSVYLSYGAGMVINDIVDVNADALHFSKSTRAIAAGRILPRSGWIYCAMLGSVSLFLARLVNKHYFMWSLSNLVVMLSYAMRLQKIFLLKNILCGWLAVSPLLGAALLGGNSEIAVSSFKLYLLGAAGFPIHVSREILKDVEDVNIDRESKTTLPLVVGERVANRIAYGIVAMVFGLLIFSPMYWTIFASRYPIYPLTIAVSLAMCTRASFLPLSEGQQLFKKSIYVLLAGMIGSLLVG